MDSQYNGAAPERVDFSKIKTSIPIPNLIEVQKKSYERFLQMDLLPNEREDIGLQTVFNSVFPISDFRGVSDLEFVDYSIGNWECKCGNLKGLHHLRSTCRNCGATIRTDPFHAGDILCGHCGTFNKNVVTFCNKCGDPVGLQLKYDMQECQERGMTYAAPLKVTIRLTVYSKDPETGKKSVRDIKEQEVFFGEIPLMTDNGTFIINGTERVIVSQLHRSPGVFFEKQQGIGYFLGKIIPYRGSWVEFEFDLKNILYVRIDRKRKFYGSVFLRALGYKTDEQILRAFYRVSKISIKDKKLLWNVDEGLTGLKLSYAITAKGGETVVGQGKKITPSLYKEIQKSKIQQVEVAVNDLEGAYIVADVVDMSTGEVLIDANSELTPTALARLLDAGIGEFEIFFAERDDVGTVISATIRKDPVKAQNEGLIEIYRKLRPGDPPTLDTATQLFQGMFFDPRKYDFSRVGRMKFNIKLHDKADATSLDKRTLDSEDFRATIKYLLKLRKGIGAVDDIDHLGNRRVRAVG
jgi:DNA-directed RNA polymerase subunit beta